MSDIFELWPATPENPNGFSREPIPEIDNYMSYSRVKEMARSMAHYKLRYIDGEKPEDTAEKQFGRVVHKALLEPADFKNEYRVIPAKEDYENIIDTVDDLKKEARENDIKIPSKSKKADIEALLMKRNPLYRKRIWSAIIEDFEKGLSESNVSIKKKDAELTLKMIDTIDNTYINPVSQKKIRDLLVKGTPEVCAYWEDKELGVIWFVRLDYIRMLANGNLMWISDLKTTRDASYSGFRKEIATYRYHYQNWIYQRVVHGITGLKTNLTQIAVEKEDPIGAATYEPEARSYETAGWEIPRLLNKLRWCQSVGRYPKYEERIIPSGPANYYYWQVEEQAELEGGE